MGHPTAPFDSASLRVVAFPASKLTKGKDESYKGATPLHTHMHLLLQVPDTLLGPFLRGWGSILGCLPAEEQ